MKFSLNLIRDLQMQKRAEQARRRKLLALLLFGYAVVAASAAYYVREVITMRTTVREEKSRLASIKMEYQRYAASEMIVNKGDVELLDQLQNSRIFWTKKLLVMARHLPDDFWITRFKFDERVLTVEGYGYITPRQEQLITLHDYLNGLRQEPTFNNIFRQVFLNATKRDDDPRRRARVSFNYAGIREGQ